MEALNYCEILGVDPLYTVQEVYDAYLHKALQIHPDRFPATDQDAFRQISYAYDILSQVSLFQWTGERDVLVQPDYKPYNQFSIQDAFRVFAQAVGFGSKGILPGDQMIHIHLQMRDILLGNYESIQIVRDDCCSECGGSGKVLDSFCRSCEGRGTVRIDERLSIEVIPGITSGNLQFYEGKGHYDMNRRQNGDLYLIFHEQLPLNIRRVGIDAHMDVYVDATTLVLGGIAFVDGIHGERLYFKVPASTQAGRTIQIPAQGFPYYRQHRVGSLICHVIPHLPNLDGSEKEIFQNLRELQIQRGGLKYHTHGKYGVILLDARTDTPMLEDDVVDLALVLQTSGLEPAFDLTAFQTTAPRTIFNAMVAVYHKCFTQGQMKFISSAEVASLLQGLQIGALFEHLNHVEELPIQSDSENRELANPWVQGKWTIYPMGKQNLNSDLLLGSAELLDRLEPEGSLFRAYDLTLIEQVDSFFIGRLIRLFKFASSHEGEIALMGVHGSVLRVLEETGIRSLFRYARSPKDLD